jgi:hypothetical protein
MNRLCFTHHQNHRSIACAFACVALPWMLWALAPEPIVAAATNAANVDEPCYLQRPASQPHVYLVYGGTRRHIPDEATLSRLGLAERPIEVWTDARVLAIPEIETLPSLANDTGRLIRGVDRPHVYWHSHTTGKKHHLPDEDSLRAYGFDFDQVAVVAAAEANAIPEGLNLPHVHVLRRGPETALDPSTHRNDLPPEVLKLLSATIEAAVNQHLADYQLSETYELKQQKWAEVGPVRTIVAEWTQQIAYQVAPNGPARFTLSSASVGRNRQLGRIEAYVEAEIDIPIKFAAQGKVKRILGTRVGMEGDTKGETTLSANIAVAILYDLATKEVAVSVSRFGTKVHKVKFNSELMNFFADIFRSDLQRTINEKLAAAATHTAVQQALQTAPHS